MASFCLANQCLWNESNAALTDAALTKWTSLIVFATLCSQIMLRCSILHVTLSYENCIVLNEAYSTLLNKSDDKQAPTHCMHFLFPAGTNATLDPRVLTRSPH